MKYKKLNVQGKEIEFWFTNGFLGEALEYFDFDIDGLIKSVVRNPFKYLPIMMHLSSKYGFERKGEVSDYDLSFFVDYLDDEGVNTDVSESFIKGLTDSIMKNVPKSESNGKAKKK